MQILFLSQWTKSRLSSSEFEVVRHTETVSVQRAMCSRESESSLDENESSTPLSAVSPGQIYSHKTARTMKCVAFVMYLVYAVQLRFQRRVDTYS